MMIFQHANLTIMQKSTFASIQLIKQRGVVLFLALIALVAMSLAAVALIRSVDTSTLIAGNLAFRQTATTSADSGIETAITLLAGMRDATGNAGKNVLTDRTHTFNKTCLATRAAGSLDVNDPGCASVVNGYHSSIDPTLNLTATATWNDVNDILGATDASGNTVQYIVQRMCRVANVAIKDADCLFASAADDKGKQNIPLPKDMCDGPGCPTAGQTPQIRVTARVTGPKNTVSYVQAFVY